MPQYIASFVDKQTQQAYRINITVDGGELTELTAERTVVYGFMKVRRIKEEIDVGKLEEITIEGKKGSCLVCYALRGNAKKHKKQKNK